MWILLKSYSLSRFQSGEPEYSWVSRHTWQSWRERYKKNAERLDKVIATIVEQKRPQPGEKGQYGYVRQAEEKQKRSNKKQKGKREDDYPTPEQYINNMIRIPVPGPPPGIVPTGLEVPTLRPAMASLHHLAAVGNPYAGVLPPPSVPLDSSTIRNSPNE